MMLLSDRLRGLSTLARATHLDATVLLVAGEQRAAAPSAAAARIRARVGEHTWARAMALPEHSLSRTLLLIEAMDPNLDAKIAAFKAGPLAHVPPGHEGAAARLAALAADRRAQGRAPSRAPSTMPGTMSGKELDRQIAAAREEQGLADRAARSGMSIEERRRAEENVNRGMARASATDDDLRAYAASRGYDEDKADRLVSTYHSMNKGRS